MSDRVVDLEGRIELAERRLSIARSEVAEWQRRYDEDRNAWIATKDQLRAEIAEAERLRRHAYRRLNEEEASTVALVVKFVRGQASAIPTWVPGQVHRVEALGRIAESLESGTWIDEDQIR